MTTATDRPARVGVVTDQTGALSFMGIANANVATMVVDDINAQGGLLGHPIELLAHPAGLRDYPCDQHPDRDLRPHARSPFPAYLARTTAS